MMGPLKCFPCMVSVCTCPVVFLWVFSFCSYFFLHLGVVVDLHTRLGVDVLGADNLTVSLQSLQLEKLGCRQKLNDKK